MSHADESWPERSRLAPLDHDAPPRARRAIASLLASLVASACSSLEHAPEPENPDLISAMRGTLLVSRPRAGVFRKNTVELVDLPSLRTREVNVPGRWYGLGGLDDQGCIAYLDTEGRWGWELRRLRVDTEQYDVVLALERNPWRVRQAPTGGSAVLWKDRDVQVEIVDLASGARRVVEPSVGDVVDVHWLPDGRVFAVDGTLDGVLVDVASGEVRDRSPGYGPFSPDGATYLGERDGAWQLIERESGRTLAAPAQFPWPYQRGSARRELPKPPTEGLCGRQLGLYIALPTDGMPTRHDWAWNGELRSEVPVLKVSDLVNGETATLRFHVVGHEQLLYSPARLAAFATEAGSDLVQNQPRSPTE